MDIETVKYLNVIRKNIILIIIISLLTAGLSYYIQSLRTTTYDAEAKIFIGNAINSPNPDLEQITLGQELALTYAELLRSYDLIEETILELGLEVTPEEAQEKLVETRVVANTMILAVSVTYDSPELAADFANTLAENLISTSPINLSEEQQSQLTVQNTQITELQEQITTMSARSVEVLTNLNEATAANNETRIGSLTTEYNTLNEQINTARSTLAQLSENYIGLTNQGNQLEIFERARPALQPNGLHPAIITIIGFLVGGILCSAVIIFFEYVNNVIRTDNEVKNRLDLPVFGTIRKFDKLDKLTDYTILEKSVNLPVSEDFRKVYTNFIFSKGYKTRSKEIYMVSSPKDGDGRTFFCVNLATQLALSDANVLLIDGDFRKPVLHRVFDLKNDRGLLPLISKTKEHQNMFGEAEETQHNEFAVTLRNNIQIHPTLENLHILTMGNEGVFESKPLPKWQSLAYWIQTIEQVFEYEYILFDTSSALPFSDAQNLAALINAKVILLIHADNTKYDEAKTIVENYRQVDVDIAGAVLNYH